MTVASPQPTAAARAAVFAVLVAIWGSTWLVIRVGLEHYPPFFCLAARFLTAGPVFLVIMKLRGERIPWTPRHQPFFLLIGLLSFVISFGVVYWGEQYVTSGLTAVIFAVFPLFTNVIAHFLIPDEKLGAGRLAGVLLALGGIVVLNSADLAQVHPMAPVAALVILVAPLSASLSSVLTKRRLHEFTPSAIAGIPMLYAGILHAVLWALFERNRSLSWSWEGVGSIAYLAFLGSVVTFSGYYWLLRWTRVGRLNLLAYLTPLVALGLGYFLAGEVFTARMAAGAALVLAGVAVANRVPYGRRRAQGV